ncbi:hypothetical protein OEZ86_005096 [Tetradesmus obliquus]|nr:hypothetical protein OEZ86_005096 [Tetradesmus obliquus]
MGLRGATLVYGPCQQQQLAPGQAFVLHDLQDCSVFLVGRLSALRLQQLRRCRVYAGPVAGATFVSGVRDCTLMVASHQVRIHDACSCDLYLRTRSHPIIEHSSGLRFAPFAIEQLAGQLQAPGSEHCSSQQAQDREQQQQQQEQQGNSLPPRPPQQQSQQEEGSLAQQLAELLAGTQLSECGGMWQAVQDFGWVKASQSPHWALLPEQQRQRPPPLPLTGQ